MPAYLLDREQVTGIVSCICYLLLSSNSAVCLCCCVLRRDVFCARLSLVLVRGKSSLFSVSSFRAGLGLPVSQVFLRLTPTPHCRFVFRWIFPFFQTCIEQGQMAVAMCIGHSAIASHVCLQVSLAVRSSFTFTCAKSFGSVFLRKWPWTLAA